MISPEAEEILKSLTKKYCAAPHHFAPDCFAILDGEFIDRLVVCETTEEWDAGLQLLCTCIRRSGINHDDRRLLLEVICESFKKWVYELDRRKRYRTYIGIALRLDPTLFRVIWQNRKVSERAFNLIFNDPTDVAYYYSKLLETVNGMLDSDDHKIKKDGIAMMLKVFGAFGKTATPVNIFGGLNIGKVEQNTIENQKNEMVFSDGRVNLIQLKGWRDQAARERIAGVQINGEIQTIEMEQVEEVIDAEKTEHSRLDKIEVERKSS